MATVWLTVSQTDLKIELAQCKDEGKDISLLQAAFTELDIPNLGDDVRLREKAGKLLDKTFRMAVAKDFPFTEPSDLKRIRRQRAGIPKLPSAAKLDEATLLDKAHGAWAGRATGCLLGKPVECRLRGQIEGYLKAQNRWPLTSYFSNAASEEVRKANNFHAPQSPCYAENITCMVEDDDTNYTTVGLAVMKQHGRDFAPADVGSFWLKNIPLMHVCTAERIAYRNLTNLIPAPDKEGKFPGRFSSATYRNPYREWIGAQIRADFFGYACPGNPQQAAELAWRDAAISHVKNGIYGEMWVAAMLASAYVLADVKSVILAGLAQIPSRSRLHRDISEVLTWRQEGRSYEDAVNAIHAKWNEKFSHHWCHTNSNAQIVAVALLWGEMDFGKTICAAVMPAFDTDCNAATAGSVLGLMLGHKRLPSAWVDPIHDTLLTGVHGFYKVQLEDMARHTLEIIQQ